ncbi:alpha/beta fold hydrolase [Nonomuraea sp. K274]|uniref:Alpha/beta fold hydrolase n=1 Tax=Nonomuraea cypriaca TaxID=1187855 RepID=A0A931F0X8_9ACTN|nr:alpha/beta hydrolase [Nonomuraea cypriaca]MBF8191329.1 alpha/beta fold hydrolase [Nonomuraea cypriaca]
MKKPIVILLLGAAALTACGTAGDPTPATAPSETSAGTVAWSPCTDLIGPDGKTAAPRAGVECGKIQVPLDYDAPDGDKIDLALIRVKATGERLGSLVFNFGGPGGSGVDTLGTAAAAFGNLGSRYDLVSFDPRGVDRSAGVKCGGQVEKLLAADTNADGDRMAEEFAQACEQDAGKVLPHVGTVNAAKDLDLLRTALGDERLNYFGMSYGTHLGAVYATHFPKNVGRFVLDGAYDPTVTWEERAVTQATGFDGAFDAFAADCVAQSCELGADPAAVQKTVESLLEKLKDDPIAVGDRELTFGLAQLAVITPLYAKAAWPMLEQATAAAIKGNGTALLALADAYTGRRPDGTYTTAMTSLQAINCADYAERPTAEQAAEINEKVEKIFPILSAEGSAGVCAHWPVRGDDTARRIDATGSAPIVVIGGKGDPATPYEWATALTAQLKTGVLVTYEGEGHGAYLSGNGCVMKTADAYLLEGKVPAQNTSCAA